MIAINLEELEGLSEHKIMGLYLVLYSKRQSSYIRSFGNYLKGRGVEHTQALKQVVRMKMAVSGAKLFPQDRAVRDEKQAADRVAYESSPASFNSPTKKRKKPKRKGKGKRR